MHESDRAGVLVRQGVGYSAFIPRPLPPDPPLTLEGKLADLEALARHELGKLDGALLTLPDADLFVQMYIRKEVVFSSQIEGTQSLLTDLLEAEAEIVDSATPHVSPFSQNDAAFLVACQPRGRDASLPSVRSWRIGIRP
jgi:Fic family protein